MTSSETPLVVAGVDGSEQSRHALEWAAKHAHQVGGRVRAVAVWHLPVQFGYRITTPEDELQQKAQRWLDDAVTRVRESYPDAVIEAKNLRGHPVDVMVEQSVEAEMLVIGNKGHGALIGTLLGSVALQVLNHARCPVVVVR